MINIPTLQEIYDDLIASIENELNITIPTIGKNVLRPLAAVQAAKLKLYYLLLGKVQKNIFIDTADPVAKGGTLERWCEVKLNRSPRPATAGEYTVEVTGTIGATIAAQTTFKSDDESSSSGFLFILDNDKTLTSSPDTMTLRALTAGLDSELIVGDTLTATVPLANIDQQVEVTVVSTTPLAAETLEEYRQAGLESFRTEPQGGAAVDYRLWASDAQGVANSYPYPSAGNATIIDLYIEATIADSTDGKGTPTPAIREAVEDVVELNPDTTLPINERGRRPLGVFQVNYLDITPIDIDITITLASGNSYTAAQKASIESAFEEELASVRPFITGADIVEDKNDTFGSNKAVFIVQNTVPTVVFSSVTVEFDGVSQSLYTFVAGNIPYLNSITYV